MIGNGIDPRRYSPRSLLLVGSFALILLAVSFFVEVRIIVTSPGFGDVTGILRTGWRTVLAIATLGSFVLAVYNGMEEDSPSDGPARTFEIKGENHDIDVHLHGIGPGEHGERTERGASISENVPVTEGNERPGD